MTVDEDLVREWVHTWWGPNPPIRIVDSDLFGPGRIEGDDADEFLGAFSQEFDVDLSGLKPWFHYCADEPPSAIHRVIPVDLQGRQLGLLPVSLSDLADAAVSKRWNFTYPAHQLKVRSWLHVALRRGFWWILLAAAMVASVPFWA